VIHEDKCSLASSGRIEITAAMQAADAVGTQLAAHLNRETRQNEFLSLFENKKVNKKESSRMPRKRVIVIPASDFEIVQ